MAEAAIHDPGASSPLRALFADRRLGAMLGLGFSSGLPLLLVYGTQSAWLSEAGVPIQTIGLLSEMTLAYRLKFVWAPFLDRYDAPVLGRLLGRRRGWIVVAQLAVMLMLAGVAFGDPAQRIGWTIGFSMALGLAGATLDTVIDGWRITVAPVERQALMSSWAEVGWRIGNLVGGAPAPSTSPTPSAGAPPICCMAMSPWRPASSRPVWRPSPERTTEPAPARSRPHVVGADPRPPPPASARWPGRRCCSSPASACRATSRTPWRCRCSRRCTIPTRTSPR